MKALDFVATARLLMEQTGRGRPQGTHLRRAVSTTYYALFHCLAECCADTLVGSTRGVQASADWRQVYRALDHGRAKRLCRNQDEMTRFPVEIQDFADLFANMQDDRHRADYDPHAIISKSAAIQHANDAENTISLFNKLSTRDRRAFAVYVLFGSQM